MSISESSQPSGRFVNGSPWLHLTWPCALAVLAVVAAFFDRRVSLAVNPDHPHALDAAAVFLDRWSTRLFLLGLFTVGFVALMRRGASCWRYHGWFALTGFLVEEAVVGVLKRLVGRPRPLATSGVLEHLRALYLTPDSKSFPSGHAATSFFCALVVALSVRYRIVRWAALAFAAAVALSRVYVGAHYLSDVLFGAAIGWSIAIVLYHVGKRYEETIAAWDGPRCLWGASTVIFLVIVGWLLSPKMPIVDALTGETIESLRASSSPGMRLRIILEPFLGPGRAIAACPDYRALLPFGLAWVAFLGAMIGWIGRRRVVGPLVCFGLPLAAAAAFAVVEVTPRQTIPLAVAPKAAGPNRTYVFDLHAHYGDPYDGHVSIERGLARARALGFDFIALTHHNAWASAYEFSDGAWREAGLYGMEWSSGLAAGHPFHVLVYNSRPEPKDLETERDWKTMIRRVHEAGGIAVAAHFWRWDETAMPTAEAAIAAGIDGFEVANRAREWGAEPIRRQTEIRRLVAERNLIGLADNDDHGRRSWNAFWMRLEAPAAKSATVAIWEALKTRRGTPELVEAARPAAESMSPFLWPPFILFAYLGELSLLQRGVWIAYALAAAALWSWFRRRRAAA